MKPIHASRMSWALSAIWLVWNPSMTLAQNALGGGNALDSNLSAIGGKYNAPTPVHDFRLSNNVVTGNVAGGRGFKGFVGYTAQNDFFGHLGTNDLYEFRADSAYSNPEVFGLGRSYELMRFGQNLGQLEPIRSGAGSTGYQLSNNSPYADLENNSARVKLDRSIILNTTAVTTEISVEPTTVGVGRDRDTGMPLLMQASPLRGLTTTSQDTSFEIAGLTMYDQARASQDKAAGLAAGKPGTPFETKFQTIGLDTRVDTSVKDLTTKVEADENAAYRKILDDIVKRYASEHNIDLKKDGDSVKTLDDQYRLLRQRLLGEGGQDNGRASTKVDTRVSTEIEPSAKPAQPPANRPGLETGIEPGLEPGLEPGQDQPTPPAPKPGQEDLTSLPPTDPMHGVTTRMPKPYAGGDKSPPSPVEPKEPEPFNPDAYGPMLRHGQTVPSLAAQDQGRMTELISSAEKLLNEGDYFSAERRFERALRYVPDHPLATAGIAHSQIGAGLYLSASLTLRNLFASHPEMIDVKYGENALPPRQRLIQVAAVVKKYLNDPDKDHAGYGFLMAYLGRQLGDPLMIEQGLNTFAEADPKAAMPALLRSVWLGHDAPPSSPPTTAPQPEK